MSQSPVPLSPQDISATLQQAVTLHQSGQLQQAEVLYQRILSVNPENPDALHLLGLIAHQVGQNDTAIQLIQKAILRKPSAPIHISLGNVYFRSGNIETAIQHYQLAVYADPENSIAANNLGTALDATGKKAGAIQLFKQALKIDPGYIDAYVNLGSALYEQQQYQEAEACFRSALSISPANAEAWYNLGNVLSSAQDQKAEAEQAFRKAIEYAPGMVEAYTNLGTNLLGRDLAGEAIKCFEKSVELSPDASHCYYNLANALKGNGDIEDAVTNYQRAIQLKPDNFEALNNLGITFCEQDRLLESLELHLQALKLEPHNSGVYFNIGLVFMKQGHLDQAVEFLQQSLKIDPNNREAHTSLIFAKDMHPSSSVTDLQNERRKWGKRFADHLATSPDFENSPDKTRKLRIGYISGDMRQHSAACVFGAMLMHFDRSQFDVIAYSNSKIVDSHTTTMQESVTSWRAIHNLDDIEVAQLIIKDEIDILVDLSGHSASNRLLVFARKPAPIQISAWGYIGGTGMKAMDVTFADKIIVPEDEIVFYTEEVRYLPSVVSYYPFTPFPAVSTLPALKKGNISFGSLNRLSKITEKSYALWSKVLLQVPNSTMLMKSPELDDASIQQSVLNAFSRHGVNPSRIALLGKTSWSEHVSAFHAIDICLDPFPHGGGVTALEGLMMGVPNIAYSWPSAPGRLSASILSTLNLKEWIAKSEDEYLKIAIEKSSDLMALSVLRKNLRRLTASTEIGNPEEYVRSVEKEYQFLWQRWCNEKRDANYENCQK